MLMRSELVERQEARVLTARPGAIPAATLPTLLIGLLLICP
jgi:hypothetical protein